MGTTAQKGAYLNQTKMLLKDKINALGGSIDDETTFREYANQLDDIYEAIPKTEYQSGSEVNLGKTIKGKLDFEDGIVGFGQTSQESTNGYNLLPHTTTTGQSGNSNGIAWRTLEDGGIKITGTSTAQVVISYTSSMKYTLEAGTYVVKNTNFAQYMKLQIWYSTATLWWELMGANTQTKVLSQDTTFENFRAQIVIPSGTTIDATIYVQLEKGSSTHTFEKYSGGYVSPSSNWKQKVECVAGKNMFKDGITFQTSASNWSDQLGTSTTTVAQIKLNSNYYDLDADTPYTFKLNSYANIDYLQVVYLDENEAIQALLGYSDLANAKTFVPVKPLRVWVRARVTNGNTDTYFIGQLEKGYVATSYKPFNTAEETISGKNLFNNSNLDNRDEYGIAQTFQNDRTLKLNGTTNGIGSIYTATSTNYTLKAGTYKWVGKVISGTGQVPYAGSDVAFYIRNSGGQLSNVVLSNLLANGVESNSFTITEDTELYFSIYANSTNIVLNNLIVGLMIVRASTTDLTYEQYKPIKNYQFSLGDYKFYGIGTYRDYILRTTGKNKYNLGTGTYSKGGFTGTYDGSRMKVNGTTTGSTNIFEPNAKSIGVFKAGSYVLSSFYTGSVNLNGHAHLMYLRSSNDLTSNNNILTQFSPSVVNSSKAFTLSQDTELFMQWYANSSGIAYDNLEVMIQVEEGSTASDYQPYGAGDWYKAQNINRKVFTGDETETWGLQSINSYGIANFLNTSLTDYDTTPGDSYGYANYFKAQTSTIAGTTEEGFLLNNQKWLYVRIDSSIASTPSEFKTWLQTHNLEVVYLAITQYTPITGTLAEQLEAWWNGQSLDGTTIIEGDGDLPMLINVRALKGAA